jgi:hypothetical protein
MGPEARCLVRHNGAEATCRALLETDELIVRGDIRLSVPLKDITEAVDDLGTLRISWPDGTAELDLGEPEAGRWQHAILHPKTLFDKLGVKDGQRVAVVGGMPGEFVSELRQQHPEPPAGAPLDVIFLAVASPSDLDLLDSVQHGLARDGAIWIVRPKGSKELPEAAVRSAARGAGLVDIKTARFSDTHTADKYVIPLDRR